MLVEKLKPVVDWIEGDNDVVVDEKFVGRPHLLGQQFLAKVCTCALTPCTN